MRYTCDHSGDRTQMCITCMNYESKIHSLEALLEEAREVLADAKLHIPHSYDKAVEAWEKATSFLQKLNSAKGDKK